MTGVRQSRRLAALAEAPSHSPSDTHAAQQQGTAPQQQGMAPDQQGRVSHQQGTAPHQQGTAPQQQERAPQQAGQPGAPQSAALLQASTLEASANVLKGLVRVSTAHHVAQGLQCTCKTLSLHHAPLDPKGINPQEHIIPYHAQRDMFGYRLDWVSRICLWVHADCDSSCVKCLPCQQDVHIMFQKTYLATSLHGSPESVCVCVQTVATGVKFLSKMQAEAMQGTLDALQVCPHPTPF